MKRILMFNLVLILMLLFYNGCTTTFYTTTNAEKVYPQTNKKDIMITTENSLPKFFEEIDYVSVHITDNPNGDLMKEILKKRAAEIGADAIVNFQIMGPLAEGIAVKFK